MSVNITKGVKGFTSRPLLERLMEKIQKTESCWIWNGAKTGGNDSYGMIWVDGKNKLAHRAMYEINTGEIPHGTELDHICRNKSCVNPDHLEPVTHFENMKRAGVGWKNREKTACPSGHEYTAENTRITHGSRSCKQCESAYNYRRWAKYKEARAAIAKAEGGAA